MSAAASRRPGGRLAVLAVGFAVAVPVLAVLWHAVVPDGSLSTDALARMLGSGRTWRLVAVTVGQAAASTALTLAVGLPVAWVLARRRFPGRRVVRTVALMPFVLPSVVVGAAFAALLGPSGVADLRGTWFAVLAAHLCFNLAVVVLVVGAAVAALPAGPELAARTLGASPGAAVRRVVLPSLAPAVAGAAVVVFLFCLTSFGVLVVLGGGAVSTLEVEIWVRATQQFDLSGAAVLAGLQVLAVVAALGLHARVTRGERGAGGGRTSAPRPRARPSGFRQWAGVAGAVLAVALVSGAPLVALLDRSLREPGGGRGAANWSSLGSVTAGTGLAVRPVDAVLVSLLSAGFAAVVAVLVAVPAAAVAARRPGGFSDRTLLVPLGVSATTVGLGLVLAVGRPPVDLRRAWWLVPAAQALVAVPLVVRAVMPALRSIPAAALDAAAVLGAGPRRRWWSVELPMVRGAVAAGAALAVVACLGEFGATVFLARSDRPTVPVAIERLLGRPGAAGFGPAMALSCVLVLLCGLVLAAVDRLGERLPGEGVRLGL
ncbi:MAG: ABC transporter permease [Microthrixaceae bacterium]